MVARVLLSAAILTPVSYTHLCSPPGAGGPPHGRGLYARQRRPRCQECPQGDVYKRQGKKGAITIATNMAGRGTDITLGGNAEYLAKAQMRKEHFCENLLLSLIHI